MARSKRPCPKSSSIRSKEAIRRHELHGKIVTRAAKANLSLFSHADGVFATNAGAASLIQEAQIRANIRKKYKAVATVKQANRFATRDAVNAALRMLAQYGFADRRRRQPRNPNPTKTDSGQQTEKIP